MTLPTVSRAEQAAMRGSSGARVCFPVRRGGRSTLHGGTADGTEMHSIAEQLDVRGAPSW